MITIEFLRQFRIYEYALFDIAVSFLGIFLLAPLLSKIFLKFGLEVPKISWIFLTLPLGILVHLLVGSFTPMTRNFIDPQGHYILKLLILSSLIFGIKNIIVTRNKN
jgi:hypothetical protein